MTRPLRSTPIPTRLGAAVLLPLFLVACGDAEPEPPQGPPVVTEQVAELTTTELLGMDRDLILVTLPWRGGAVTRTASEAAATGIQNGVEALTGNGFDRVVLSFHRGAAAPGYRVWDPGSEPVELCGEQHTFEENGVVVQLVPARVRDEDGRMLVEATELDLGMPVIEEAELVCEGERQVAWFLRTAPERVEVRLLHLRTPDRIAIDVRAADGAAEEPATVEGAAAPAGAGGPTESESEPETRETGSPAIPGQGPPSLGGARSIGG